MTEEEKLFCPRFNVFLDLPPVAELWTSDHYFVNEEIWSAKQAETFDHACAGCYMERLRMMALVRAAHRGQFVQPNLEFGDPPCPGLRRCRGLLYSHRCQELAPFDVGYSFDHITSHFFFFVRSWESRGRHSPNNIDIHPYPAMLDHGLHRPPSYHLRTYEDSPLDVSGAVGRQFTTVVKVILTAAELDEETATLEQLAEKGKTFRWLDFLVYEKDRELWEWRQLVSHSFRLSCRRGTKLTLGARLPSRRFARLLIASRISLPRLSTLHLGSSATMVGKKERGKRCSSRRAPGLGTAACFSYLIILYPNANEITSLCAQALFLPEMRSASLLPHHHHPRVHPRRARFVSRLLPLTSFRLVTSPQSTGYPLTSIVTPLCPKTRL